MMNETLFDTLMEKAKTLKYTSMNYIDFSDCENAEVLCNREDLIILHDTSKEPAMLYFAAADFVSVIEAIAKISGKLRIHFVPREYAPQLAELGFAEWGEYVDFWNYNLAETAAQICNGEETVYLDRDACAEASELSQKCRRQSRGFEGETAEWFAEWLDENKVIIQREGAAITGFCCVSIYNNGTTLWIREIAVDPAYQGRGIGKKLMEQAICYGIENGAIKSFLAADILNHNAIGLYVKYGFSAKDGESELQVVRE